MIIVALVVAYIVAAGLFLLGGDRLGTKAACLVSRRCGRSPLLSLPVWIYAPLALLIPAIILSGFVMTALVYGGNTLLVLANNMELLLLAAFFVTGLIGGFFAHARRPRE